MCVVRSRVDARDIKAFDGFAFVVYSLEVLVDGDAVQGAQHVAGGAYAVERSGTDSGQTVRVFAEIGVNAGIEVFVLSLDRRLKRIGGDAQAFGELLDGVGDDNVSVVDQTLVEAFDGIERLLVGAPLSNGKTRAHPWMSNCSRYCS